MSFKTIIIIAVVLGVGYWCYSEFADVASLINEWDITDLIDANIRPDWINSNLDIKHIIVESAKSSNWKVIDKQEKIYTCDVLIKGTYILEKPTDKGWIPFEVTHKVEVTKAIPKSIRLLD